MKKVIVTGAAGFIGSAFCRYLLANKLAHIVAVDAMTYAASPRTVKDLQAVGEFSFHRQNICDAGAMHALMKTEKPDAVVHLAAESHVDRSIDSPGEFVQTNMVGSYNLLEAARSYWQELEGDSRSNFRFLQVSTDEVYGSLGASGQFSEATSYAPNSPYAASKAASDHLARAWYHTFGLPTLISNCSNNYGPYQFPEKLIPNIITKALAGEKLPVYGTGTNVRDWLFVDDHANALWTILSHGKPGEKYLVGGDGEKNNLTLVHEICDLLEHRLPRESGSYRDLIAFVEDRPGHDQRYAIDYSKIRTELNWSPSTLLPAGLAATVDWYLANREWWQEIKTGHYARQRLGQIKRTAHG